MKLGTLIQRLTEKTNTYYLREMILHKRPLPDRCMIWTGAHTQEGPKFYKQKDQWGVSYLVHTIVRPYAKITFNGKPRTVHQVLYQLVYPDRKRPA